MESQIRDGRKIRSELTTNLIIDTVFSIIDRGVQEISFELIAKEAGIGTRTIFRHFNDKEALIEAVNSKLLEKFESSFPFDKKDETLKNRKISLINFLCSQYSKNENMFLITLKNVWHSNQIYKNVISWNVVAKKYVLQILPEIEERNTSEQEIIFHCLSFTFWEKLSIISNKNQEEIKKIFLTSLDKFI